MLTLTGSSVLVSPALCRSSTKALSLSLSLVQSSSRYDFNDTGREGNIVHMYMFINTSSINQSVNQSMTRIN